MFESAFEGMAMTDKVGISGIDGRIPGKDCKDRCQLDERTDIKNIGERLD